MVAEVKQYSHIRHKDLPLHANKLVLSPENGDGVEWRLGGYASKVSSIFSSGPIWRSISSIPIDDFWLGTSEIYGGDGDPDNCKLSISNSSRY